MSAFSWSLWRGRLKQLRIHARALFIRFRNALFSLRTLISICGIALMLLIFTVAIVPVRYDISVGMVPTHTITANRDVVDEITTEALRNEAAQKVQPKYYYAEGISDSVLANFDQIFTQLDAAIQYSNTLEDHSPSRRYTAEELEYARSIITEIDFLDYQLRTLLNTTREDLLSLYTTLSAALQNTLSGNIAEGAEEQAIDSIMKIVGYRVDTSLLQNVVQPVLRAVVRPNMIIDQEETAKARQAARESIEPVLYKQGQNIVVKGEGRVERYQYDMLSNLGLLNNSSSDSSIYWGAALMVFLIMTISMVLLRLTDKETAQSYKRLLLLFTVTSFTLICCILARMVNIYLAPVVACAMLLSTMIGIQASVIFNVSLALLVSALAAGGSAAYTSEMVQILACTLCSGTLAAALLYRRGSRLRIIMAGLAAGMCNFLVMLSLGLMTSSTKAVIIENALWCMGGALLSGALCLAVQPLLEAIFNLATPNKLMELSNPNHPLLRRLLLEAPGTYHHSIVVANLAEAAAEAIGANPLLARVGGYYHDVGKLRRPQFFKENQLGSDNKLDETDPYTAAQIVISHTRDGVVLAHNYHLPREVITIIAEHHGNTPVMYFYSMAVKNADGAPVDAANFRYEANPPSTKEGAIVLLCDTIEAAVRSMHNPTPSTIEEFIVKLIRGKLQDGQLSNSPLTLRDIDAICHASATVLNGVFHERIEYPDPPAHIAPPKEHASSAPVVTNEELTKPWDGISEEKESTPKAAETGNDNNAAEISENIQPILVDPSQFESEKPLPVVDIPMPSTPLSIEEVLERDQTKMSAPETADEPEQPVAAENGEDAQ